MFALTQPEPPQPVFLFAVASGLSTDYGVLLLARIAEGRDTAGACCWSAVLARELAHV